VPPFQVELDFYHGPLDLLVVLVRQGEIDVLELAISEITHRYVETQELREGMNVEEMGDFLILAASLMELKSRQLLPSVDESPLEIEAEGAKHELVKQLLEYRRFREAASLLGERAAQRQRRLARQSQDLASSANDLAQQPIGELELWDLVSAFSRLMRENIVPVADTVEKDPTPLPVYMNRLEASILAAGDQGISFRSLLGTTNTRSQIIGKFLATLELIKTRRVWVEVDPAREEICFFPPRHDRLEFFDDDSMVMADTSEPPPEASALHAPLEDDEESAVNDLLARLSADEDNPTPGSGWDDYESLDES
jgi:segregation and condensation protein A